MNESQESNTQQKAVASDDFFSVVDWPKVPLRNGAKDRIDHEWRVAINKFSYTEWQAGREWPHWMYQAKAAALEVPRLALLFQKERTGNLCVTFRRFNCCGDGKHVVDNHLTCCLGEKCRECPFLDALDKAEMSEESRDWIKAWTCAGHILSTGGDMMNEGFIHTVYDRMFWDSVHSLASAYGQEDEEKPNPDSSLNSVHIRPPRLI